MTDRQTPHENIARNYAIEFLRKDPALSPERIREVASKALAAARILVPDLDTDIDTLTAELRHIFSVYMESAKILQDDDPAAHVPWLLERRGSITWRFWRRYMEYLERDFGMPPPVVSKLDELTDDILSRLEDPGRDGPWDRRGMVVGSVQSGKTANYTGLICKAIDSGYKLVIVLAGIHSNLRAQTQLRIDEGVLGFDTQKSRRLDSNSRWIGVGTYGERLVVHSLTSSAEDGDFNKKVADTIGVMLGGDPVVLIVKKNSRLLGNLIKWVQHVHGRADPVRGKKVIPDVPLLLIDDEADNASINTSYRKTRTGEKDHDSVSAINRRIREILSTFERSAYVGYTATPFANIFINPSAESEALGEDIFPRSFIINVRAPSDYVGPSLVFGMTGDRDAGIPDAPPLPIHHRVDDFDKPERFPAKHDKDHVPTELPESLRTAVRCFLLACAARRARGQTRVHNSMLVHVTRFVAVQERVAGLLTSELLPIQRRIEFGDGNRSPSIRDELRELWEKEFVPISVDLGHLAGAKVTWQEVEKELHPAVAKVVVRQINGFAREALEYKDHQSDGLSVIAVGGDKLSRGLTLEGLTVSYFLRTSRMYDTLMQMGRWFGYRPGYLDLCRLFTTQQLLDWYRHIALAEMELRREFDYMVAADRSPREYGLRVRTHPDGMIVTALNKMCHSQTLELSWAGVLVQTTQLPMDGPRTSANLRALESFVSELGEPERSTPEGTCVWREVPAGRVCSFIESLQMPPESARASGRELAAFIRRQASSPEPELFSWTVALVSNERSEEPRQVAGFKIGLIKRTPESQKAGDSFGLRKDNILSPKDEATDLRLMPATPAALSSLRAGKPSSTALDIESFVPAPGSTLASLALDITRRRIASDMLRGSEDTSVANGRVIREVRPRSHGLLLIYPLIPPSEVADGQSKQPTGLSPKGDAIVGVALSFPTSDTARRVEYQVNRVWSAELEEDSLYED